MLQMFLAFKAKSKMLSKRFNQMAQNKVKKNGSSELSKLAEVKETATFADSEDEDTFSLARLKKEKQFANLKELKVTFDYDGKVVPVKEANASMQMVSPNINIDQQGSSGADGRVSGLSKASIKTKGKTPVFDPRKGIVAQYA